MSKETQMSNDSSNKERPVGSFHVGYYHLHPNVSLNYQMNRFSTGEADMISDRLPNKRKRLTIDKLLTRVLDAQRRLDRWSGMQTLTARVS